MPLTAPQRIAREAGRPFLVELWRALMPLRSTVSFMNTGAHPDDEISDLLAKLSLGDGLDVSYACSTRGEGGQNDIGREATQALGVLRTAEMEQAALRLGMRLYWLSESPQDSVFDFGFSKSGQETLKKWGRARTLKRFVDILRSERPDIVCTTFLDVPGQHGHHRAMTEAAEEAIGLAADPAYVESALPVWSVSKFYLPAWSGAGQAYDDDLPPPPATITVSGKGFDPATGQSFQRLGQWSRACHLTQAMGRWVPHGTEADWPLHLKLTNIGGAETSLISGLPESLADLGGGDALRAADQEIAAAVEAFGDGASVLGHATAALKLVREGAETVDPRYAHKIARKETQLANLIRIAARIDCRAWLDRDILQPDDTVGMTVELHKGLADSADADPVLPEGWEKTPGGLKTRAAAPSNPYPDRFLPDEPEAPFLSVDVSVNGVTSTSRIPFEVPPQIRPAVCADLSPSTAVVNLSSSRRSLHLGISSVQPEGSVASLHVPEGWDVSQTEDGFVVSLPRDVPEGLYKIGVRVDGREARSVQTVSYPHTAPRHLSAPAEVAVLAVEAGPTVGNIGYIGAGNDRVEHWLDALGFSVTTLSPEDLTNETVLERLQTIVIGIFAMRFQESLKEAMPALHRWVQRGGTLLTLYHRPWDNWDPDTVPPARLEIGQPSLRWRVTDENAAVSYLEDNYPVLTVPNMIGPDDWKGWHKERGLYFAKSWDPAYRPLLQMADPDEAPHQGALLTGDFGEGRHIHCALILHHQMEKLVPGAFRLMVNLVTPRS
ncbi:PIG-L family deacetylase [Roseibium sp. HPY-6]|uniref:PIG-L family deacetylase n=1 Tax=Roseibium sp. HPY-6 TaxID=3229852 RepID=UPI00338FAF8F